MTIKDIEKASTRELIIELLRLRSLIAHGIPDIRLRYRPTEEDIEATQNLVREADCIRAESL